MSNEETKKKADELIEEHLTVEAIVEGIPLQDFKASEWAHDKENILHALITVQKQIDVLIDVNCLGENDELQAIKEELNSRL